VLTPKEKAILSPKYKPLSSTQIQTSPQSLANLWKIHNFTKMLDPILTSITTDKIELQILLHPKDSI